MRAAPRGAAGRSCLLLLNPLFVYGAVATVYAPRPRRACLEFQDGSRLGLWKETCASVGATIGRDAGLLDLHANVHWVHAHPSTSCRPSGGYRRYYRYTTSRNRATTKVSACSYYYRTVYLSLVWPVLSCSVAELHVCSGADAGPT